MIINKELWSVSSLIAVCCFAFCGCSTHEQPVKKVPAVSAAQLTPEISRLFFDISQAQSIEKKEPGAKRPDQLIKYEFGTDSLHKAYTFSNLRALRIDIKRRIDSLKSAKVVFSYDTILSPSVRGTLKEHPVSRNPVDLK